jgi:tetratricopeptide (TPR) repeat protein
MSSLLSKMSLTLDFLGQPTYRELGEYDKAIEALNKALNIWQEFGILRFEGEVHVALGYTWLELEEYDQSIHSFQAALDVAQAVDNAYLQQALLGSWLKLYLVIHSAFLQTLQYLDFKVWSLSPST